MSKIRVLDDNTINKIAAGEVVERPHSIVKELVENSIDAFSTSITIEVKNGGKTYIRVTDNGTGISGEDMETAFLRHSTSKIKDVEDLQSIITLGFRGEALASIASVSQLEVLSKIRESEKGNRLVIFAGEVREKSEIGTSNGTTIIVKNLFYNIPVRKKFLKTDAAESSMISELIYKLALGNPSISFKYIKDGTVTVKTPGNGSLEDVVYSLFGKEFIKNTVSVSKSIKDIELKGLVSKSSFSRGNRSHQHFFINGRSIKSLDFSKRIEELYKSMIPSNRFPVFILFIDMDPKSVDVNIHPSKTEVRFLKQEELFSLVEKTVKTALYERDTVSETSLLDEKSTTEPQPKVNLSSKSKKYESAERPRLLDPKLLYDKDYDKKAKNPDFKSNQIVKESRTDKKESYKTEKKDYKKYVDPSPKAAVKEKLPPLAVIGTIFTTYILAEDKIDKSLWIIDQHAAHERIMYEKLSEEILNGKVYIQEVLAVEPIELSLTDMEKLNQFSGHLKKIGFEFEEFGTNTIMLRGVPLVFGSPKYKELFIDILDNIEFGIKNSHQIKLEKIMKLACSSAVKAGDSIKPIEVEQLLKELSLCENPLTCPHGRPTVIKIKKQEIEKKFKRI